VKKYAQEESTVHKETMETFNSIKWEKRFTNENMYGIR